MPSRADVLLRYGLPNTPAFEIEVQQQARQTVRAKHEGGAVSMSTGHLSSLAHEIGPIDFLLAQQIQTFLKKAGL
jgi:hypothetical protein